jgi:hypothetical protein
LVGSSGMADEFRSAADTDETSAINVIYSDFPVPKAAFKTVFPDQGRSSFSIAGKNYLVDSMRIEISAGKYWSIVTYADQNDFLSTIRRFDDSTKRTKEIMASYCGGGIVYSTGGLTH